MLAPFVAEFLGTFTLIFIGAGAICADALSGGKIGIIGIALAHGLAIMTGVYAYGHISGAHYNPAVTASMWVTGKMKSAKAIGYWISQLLGGSAAGFLLARLHGELIGVAPYLGTPDINPAVISVVGAVVVEAVLTFFLVSVIWGMGVDPRVNQRGAIGLAIGLTITLDILMGGWLTGAAMNPARAFGTAIASGHWANHLVYWVGPLLGGVVAGLVYNNIPIEQKK